MNKPTQQSGKIVLVTGAASGMGRLACTRSSQAGALVAALDINEEGLAATQQTGANIHRFACDVSDAAAVDATLLQVRQRLGDPERVYSAAAILPCGLALEHDRANIRMVMDINYGGLVNISQATLPQMLARGKGEFISFASIAGHVPALYMSAYCASKFAAAAFTEVLYHENRGRGVRICCVCPPPVATPLLQQARDTVMPKVIEESEALAPEVVLDAIEAALEKNTFWVFPGPETRRAYRMRRWLPDLLWKRVHDMEGR